MTVIGGFGALVGCGGGDDGPEPVVKEWSVPVRLDDPSSAGERGQSAQVSIDGSGNTLAIWRQGEPAKDGQILFSRSAPGGAWSIPAMVGPAGKTNGDGVVDLSMDTAGNAVAVWDHNDNVPSDRIPLLARPFSGRYTPSSGWSGVGQVAPQSSGGAYPQVALGPSGNALTVWGTLVMERSHVFASTSASGAAWSQQIMLDSRQIEAFAASIRSDGSGRAIATYYQANNQVEIVSHRYDPATGWSRPVSISGALPGVNLLFSPSLAVNDGGTAVAVWLQAPPGALSFDALEFWASTAAPGGAWSAPVRLGAQEGTNQFPAILYGSAVPSVAIDAGGNAIALLPHAAGSSTANMLYSRYTAASGWSTPVPVGPSLGFPLAHSEVAFDADGHAIAVWSAREQVIQSRFDGTVWTPPAVLSTTTSGPALDPRITVSRDGRAVALWCSGTSATGVSGGASIWAARFE